MQKPRDFGMQGRMPPLKPTGTATSFPSSDSAMDKGRKGGKKMAKKVEFPSEVAAGRGLEHTKSLILWIWQDWLCQHEVSQEGREERKKKT